MLTKDLRWAVCLFLVAVCNTTTSAWAADMAACTVSMPVGATCTVSVAALRPTQFALGAIEVQKRAKKLRAMSATELERYKRAHVIPLVVSPDHAFYATDHHHFAVALAQVEGRNATLVATIQENFGSVANGQFWVQMEAAHYLYLFDENGDGPLQASSLPASLFTMGDDPYRSLAWGVQNEGGYDVTTVPHAEFQWADFFRTRIDRSSISDDFEGVVSRGLELARSPEARGLPGYRALHPSL